MPGMRYLSTRGAAEPVGFEEALLSGVAPDGGLYLPERLAHFAPEELATWRDLPYAGLAERLLAPFVGDALDASELSALCERAWRLFPDPPAPLRALDAGEWVLELFHGPTLAFKDYALQPLGHLIEHALARRGERAALLGATSGDTGSAAIAGAAHCPRAQVFILHPAGRVSEIQRRQMTTERAENIHNIAVEGDFDDCQRLVKALFGGGLALPDGYRMISANSINWARVMAQTVYYFSAALALDAWHARSAGLRCAVPTGNFGNAYAAWLARRMGLPLRRLIVATNANDVVHRMIADNRYRRGQRVARTLAPSMDIAVASNVERLLFDLHDGDGARVAASMRDFDQGQAIRLPEPAHARMRAVFASERVDDQAIRRTMREAYQRHGYRLDPHSATGVAAGRALTAKEGAAAPLLAVATAHPAKFPEATEAAGLPALAPAQWPASLAGITEREERCVTLPASLDALAGHIQQRL